MDVYLIPVGDDRYALYCEHTLDEDMLSPDAPAGSSRLDALVHRVKVAVAQAEQEHRSGETGPPPSDLSWLQRIRRRMLCWIAEKMAEWRLLWRLRKESNVAFHTPDDLTADQAVTISRRMLQREADRHLKWAIIDGALFCISGVVALVPGPNPLAYYFGFRFVGHFLSRRGATHGLEHVSWHPVPRSELTLLRSVMVLAAPERQARVEELGHALQLPNLATFFERTAIPAA